MSRTLYLIDGHAQIFRAYYAPFRNLTSPSGEPTRATFVFFQMLINLIRDRRPDAVIMTLDTSDKTVFRREHDADYKAHRDETPEDLGVQIDRIVSILEALGMPILRVPGFEADDIIATVARQVSDDWQVFIVSRDKDLDQLLAPRVSLFDPLRDEVVTHEQLLGLKGWSPQQAIDAQTLIGDAVDNIRGAAGVGPKTAAKLLQKYNTLDDIFAHAEEQTPKLRDALKELAGRVETVRKLVTLRTDVPLQYDLAAAESGKLDWRRAAAIFNELGLRRLVERLPVAAEILAESPTPPRAKADAPAGLFSNLPAASAAPAEPTEATQEASESPDAAERHYPADLLARLRQADGGRYRLIESMKELETLVAALRQEAAFAIDTETTGLSAIESDLIGISLAWQPGAGYYLPLQTALGTPLSRSAVQALLNPLLSDSQRLKVGHNLKYDLLTLRQAGFEVAGPFFDTLIAGFIIEPQPGSLKLDNLVQRLLKHTMIPITDLIGKGSDQLRLDQVPLAHVAEYAGEDADYTWRLYELFRPVLDGSDLADLFYRTEMPLVSVLVEMESNGIQLDADYLRELGVKMRARCAEIVDNVCRLAGTRFNLDSPKQLAEVLFDKLGFRVVRMTRTTRSTDAETLSTLASETNNPILTLLLEYRETQKLLGTYVEALPKAVSRKTGRIHTSYSQTGAVTGRLSSSDPNLQNIPIRTDAGRGIRRAFVARDAAHLLVSADYSQVELRVLAHFSHDAQLIEAFVRDIDIHTFVAAQVAGVPVEQVSKDMRSRAKAVNFGIIYGQTAFGLSQSTGMSQAEARRFIEDYFRRYPQVRAFIDDTIERARRCGFVKTILGRRRAIPELQSANRGLRSQGERLAVNTIIQGSAADLIKLAMIELDRRIRSEKLPLKMLLQVHDELVFELPRNRAREMCEIIQTCMESALPLSVPLKVDLGQGDNWLEAK